MLNFFFGRRNSSDPSCDPKLEIERLIEFSPPAALVYNHKGRGSSKIEYLGKSFLLRRDNKLYAEGIHFYITTPENLKLSTDQNLSSKTVSLHFYHRRIPHRIVCRILGRFHLLPEIVGTLDFHAQAAYKLIPISSVRKQEKRQFLRYTMRNYGDTRLPLTSHVTFQTFVRTTSETFPVQEAPVQILKDLTTNPHVNQESCRPVFSTREAIAEFRTLMLNKQRHERYISISKIFRPRSTGMILKPDIEVVLGKVNVLALEMESLRDVLYLKRPIRASGGKKGRDSSYSLHEGERIIGRFSHDGKFYELLLEIVEARTQNEVVKPLSFIRSERGLEATVVNYSAGGLLIESSPAFLSYVLQEKCPHIDENTDFLQGPWPNIFAELRQHILHFTLYPRMDFPEAVKQFKPEVPFKFSVLMQIVRTHLKQVRPKNQVLQHGLQIAYQSQAIPMKEDDIVPWHYLKNIKDFEHLRNIHSKLSQLYGYLETQIIAAEPELASRPRPPTPPPASAN
ncbi:MAG: hypothetical protein FJY95_01270 [Candidatus Handelsmanbacteria bacterium]|nr:hypothetical protein [Candidatus Handelsmanbacteria bacterium]